jgi:hypothetical protein
MDMLLTKRCEHEPMECNGDNCIYNKDPVIKYEWLKPNDYISYKCEMFHRTIVGEKEDSVLFPNTVSSTPCHVQDYFCKTSDSVIIWNPDVIHKCPFEYVQSGSFEYEDNLLIDRKQSILFQVISSETACDIDMLVTSEGLYLTNNTKALNFPNATRDVKIINDFMLSETDFNKEDTYIQLQNMLQKSNLKFCYLYLAYLKLFAKIDDKFFTFTDFYGNEVVLYSNQNTIFIPSCMHVPYINIIEQTKACYEDFPIAFNYDNKTVNAFLTTDNIIRATSKQIPCENLKQHIFLKQGTRILQKRGYKITLESTRGYQKIKLNLQEQNLGRINFLHNYHIIQSVNILKQFQEITTIQEEVGDFHVIPDNYNTMRHQWTDAIEKVKITIPLAISDWTHKAILYIIILITLVIIYKRYVHNHIFSTRNQAEQINFNSDDAILIQQLLLKYKGKLRDEV